MTTCMTIGISILIGASVVAIAIAIGWWSGSR